MASRDLYDQIMLHLENVLESDRWKIQQGYRSFLSDDFVIFRGRQANIPKYPVIEIIRGTVSSAWSATQTIRETYNYFLDCSIRHASREVSGEFVTTFGRTIQLLLNSYSNLSFDIPGTINVRGFDSFAPTSDPGFRRAAGERTSRVAWWCKVENLVAIPG